MKRKTAAGAALFYCIFLVANSGYCDYVDSLTFVWDAAASGEQITGYKLCLGGTSRGAVLEYTAFRYDLEYDAGAATQYTVAGLSRYTSVVYASVIAYRNTQVSSYSREVVWDNTPRATLSSTSSSSSSVATTTTTTVITPPAITSTTSSSSVSTTVGAPSTTSSSSTSIISISTTTSSAVSTTTQPIDKPYDLQFRWNKR